MNAGVCFQVSVVMIVIPESLNDRACDVHVNNVNNVVMEGSSCGDHSRPAVGCGTRLGSTRVMFRMLWSEDLIFSYM